MTIFGIDLSGLLSIVWTILKTTLVTIVTFIILTPVVAGFTRLVRLRYPSFARPVPPVCTCEQSMQRRDQIDWMINKCMQGWDADFVLAAHSYAQGLMYGMYEPITDPADKDTWDKVVAAANRLATRELDDEAWEIGIGAIHALACGDLEGYDTSVENLHPEGWQPDKVSITWNGIHESYFDGTGYTLKDVVEAFQGDVKKAAHAFLRSGLLGGF
ncbi:hypothetical protein D5S17_35655 [Pseudonocardiaceae bacterium YIM PH 21723]|nr:hypothetical protein D5S17_35655 [Pseudonocardiaceae bacterium YIM PH 21723]